jgi:hypothetical protein
MATKNIILGVNKFFSTIWLLSKRSFTFILLEKVDKVLGSFLESKCILKLIFSKFKTANGILKAYKVFFICFQEKYWLRNGFYGSKSLDPIFWQPPWLESKFINNMLSITTKIKKEALFTFFFLKKKRLFTPTHKKNKNKPRHASSSFHVQACLGLGFFSKPKAPRPFYSFFSFKFLFKPSFLLLFF